MPNENLKPETETGVWLQHHSYSGFYETRGEIFYPRSIERIRHVFSLARVNNRKVSFRGEGYSFDSQGLNNDLLVSLKNFNHIRVNPVASQVTVGAGTTWADILKSTLPFNLLPAVMVSTGHASAGGTLSANCMSRFSPVWGREGKWVDSFKLITVDGELRQCSRNENSDLFYAAIGGFGCFGAITEITYNLVPIPANAKVKTLVIRKGHAADLYKDILPGENKTQTVYSAFGISSKTVRTMTCVCEYRYEAKVKPMLPHRPYLSSRLMSEFLIQWLPPMGQMIWNYAYAVYTRLNNTFIDNIDEYTFFMDANVRAKKLGKKLGIPFRAVQQTFVVPAGEQELNQFLNETLKVIRMANLPPAMMDALYLPEDEKFLLSSSLSGGGYALSMAFESISAKKFEKVKSVMEHLSKLCLVINGKVHLTKNVLAKPADVQAMYKNNLDQFFAIKRKYDPQGILRNDFIDRIFPDYVF